MKHGMRLLWRTESISGTSHTLSIFISSLCPRPQGFTTITHFSLTLTFAKLFWESSLCLKSPLIWVPLEPILMCWRQGCWVPRCGELRGQPGVEFGWGGLVRRCSSEEWQLSCLLLGNQHLSFKLIQIPSYTTFSIYNANWFHSVLDWTFQMTEA